jgi:hypothetical protein
MSPPILRVLPILPILPVLPVFSVLPQPAKPPACLQSV